MTYIPAHGSTFTWGTTSFLLTSVSVSANAGSEIDVTSMSSEVVTDSDNSRQKKIVPDYDSCISGRYGSEVSIDFRVSGAFTATNYFDILGTKRTLKFQLPSQEDGTGTGFSIEKTALLMQMQLNAAVGEYVSGSATFRVSGR